MAIPAKLITCEIRDYTSVIKVEDKADITTLPTKSTGVYLLLPPTATTAEISSLLDNIKAKIIHPKS
ncbi:MAG: hypothetical protein ACTSP4_00675 [Candidatus Hodarchaeales archaeon]